MADVLEPKSAGYYTRLRSVVGTYLGWIESGGDPGDAAAWESLAAAYEDRQPDPVILGTEYIPDAS